MNGNLLMNSAAHHPVLDKLANAETRCNTIANDEQAICDYLVEKIDDPTQSEGRGTVLS